MSDLFELTRGFRGLGGMIARFHPSKYPVVPGGMKNNIPTWKRLSSDIIAESKRSGKSILVSNGSHGKDSDRVVLICNRYRLYRGNRRHKKADKDSVCGNEGTNTSKAILGSSNGANCKAKLVIGVDSRSFFLVCGIGNNIHTGHPPLSSEEMPRTRKRTVVPENVSVVAQQMANREAKPGLIASAGVLKDQFNVENDSINPAPGTRESARAEALPHVQDFLNAYAGISSQEARKWARNEMDALTNKLNQIRRQEQESAAPKGNGGPVNI